MPRFIIQKNELGSSFYQLLSPTNSILLTGLKHEFNQSCYGEILSVRMNCVYADNYEVRLSPSKDYIFVIHSIGSGKIIGISEMYLDLSSCEKAISLVKKYGEAAKIV